MKERFGGCREDGMNVRFVGITPNGNQVQWKGVGGEISLSSASADSSPGVRQGVILSRNGGFLDGHVESCIYQTPLGSAVELKDTHLFLDEEGRFSSAYLSPAKKFKLGYNEFEASYLRCYYENGMCSIRLDKAIFRIQGQDVSLVAGTQAGIYFDGRLKWGTIGKAMQFQDINAKKVKVAAGKLVEFNEAGLLEKVYKKE